ncbi:hypothetical protein K438DRAFT_1811934 [Mycena galopus ATCC 62051]|nr:hypothetical protein K438DRAFT_1811934 [Mycena galopus ATCC 62051]
MVILLSLCYASFQDGRVRFCLVSSFDSDPLRQLKMIATHLMDNGRGGCPGLRQKKKTNKLRLKRSKVRNPQRSLKESQKTKLIIKPRMSMRVSITERNGPSDTAIFTSPRPLNANSRSGKTLSHSP